MLARLLRRAARFQAAPLHRPVRGGGRVWFTTRPQGEVDERPFPSPPSTPSPVHPPPAHRQVMRVSWVQSALQRLRALPGMSIMPSRVSKAQAANHVWESVWAQSGEPAFFRDLGAQPLLVPCLRTHFELALFNLSILRQRFVYAQGMMGWDVWFLLEQQLCQRLESELRGAGVSSNRVQLEVGRMMRTYQSRMTEFSEHLNHAMATGDQRFLSSTLWTVLYSRNERANQRALDRLCDYAVMQVDALRTQKRRHLLKGKINWISIGKIPPRHY